MSSVIRVSRIQHPDSNEPSIVLNSNGTIDLTKANLSSMPFNNQGSDLEADNVQQAIVELSARGSGLPAGAVQAFAMNTPPSGWLKCNGEAVSRTTYSDLFTAIGVAYGEGDGSTTFNVPDLRAEFIRGWDDGRGIDTNRSIGSTQENLNKEHSHGGSTQSSGEHTHSASTNTTGSHSHSNRLGTGTYSGNTPTWARQLDHFGLVWMSGQISSSGDHNHTVSVDSTANHSHDITTNPDGGSEARPRNVALLYCIKY